MKKSPAKATAKKGRGRPKLPDARIIVGFRLSPESLVLIDSHQKAFGLETRTAAIEDLILRGSKTP